MRKAYTINPNRTKTEIKTYHQLHDKGLYQGIEIFYPYNLSHPDFLNYSLAILELKEKYKDLEIVMHLPFGRDNNLADFNDCSEIIKRMINGLDYADIFGIKKLTLHLGIIQDDLPRAKYIDQLVQVLKILAAAASKNKQVLMIENMPSANELGYSPNEILEIIKKTSVENLRFTLDVGHANLSSYGIFEYLDILKDYLAHLHLSDNSGGRDEHAPLGTGKIEFGKIIKKLKEINYKGLYCLEILFDDVNDLMKNALDLDKYDK